MVTKKHTVIKITGGATVNPSDKASVAAAKIAGRAEKKAAAKKSSSKKTEEQKPAKKSVLKDALDRIRKGVLKSEELDETKPETIEEQLDTIKEQELPVNEEIDQLLEDAAQQNEEQSETPTFELLTATINTNNSPVSGVSRYIVVAKGKHSVTLLHPFTLTQFKVPAVELAGSKDAYGEIPAERMAACLEKKMREFASMNRQAPYQLIRRIIANLRGVRLDAVEQVKAPAVDEKSGERKERGFAATRKVGVWDEIERSFIAGTTVDELHKHLQKTFPDRDPKSLLSTIKTQVSKMPKKLGMTMTKTQDKKRGTIYQMK